MKELDFDELDRAVNTLMGNVTSTAEPPKQDDTRVLTITETLTDDRPPVFPVGQAAAPAQSAPTPEPVAVRSQPTVQERPAPLAARRGGRFMDVVPPSSMTRKPTPSQGVSRQGVSLAPLDTASNEQETLSSIPVERPDVSPVSVIEASDSAVIESDTSEWPDPLEFNQTSEADDTPVVDAPLSDERDTAEPLSSPFLADAKVEKRPLGTPAPELYTPQQPEQDTTDVEVETTPEPTLSEPVDQPVEVELPEELRGDLMAIESNISNEQVVVPQASPASSAAEATNQPRESEAPKTVATAAVTAPAVSLPVGGGSIPQQYREEPSTGDQTTGSIYDTASYHQPLEHPAKKKAGWLWVIWVLVLLVLGAGGGALAYLYLLQ
jgi:hypothetical protein